MTVIIQKSRWKYFLYLEIPKLFRCNIKLYTRVLMCSNDTQFVWEEISHWISAIVDLPRRALKSLVGAHFSAVRCDVWILSFGWPALPVSGDYGSRQHSYHPESNTHSKRQDWRIGSVSVNLQCRLKLTFKKLFVLFRVILRLSRCFSA